MHIPELLSVTAEIATEAPLTVQGTPLVVFILMTVPKPPSGFSDT